MNVVIYARYSSHNQTEQSIEGQLEVCYQYAKENNYTVVGEYIDRALSGTNDNRPQFQQMIEDSNKKFFQIVLVYQFDRFSRNRCDSAIYKNKLKKNDVIVVSARENIADDPSGVLVESLIEGMAEYFSRDLSQKVTRGMRLNAEKCIYNGGGVPLGLCVDDEKKFQIDEKTAPIVRKIFDMYANGETMATIINYMNSIGMKTAKGMEFKKNSLRAILTNKRYIGTYKYGDIEIENAFPSILSKEVFFKVQDMMVKNKTVRSRAKAKNEYLLTTKLFCGHCKEMMTGTCGTSRNKQVYHYYVCNGVKKNICNKKSIQKDYIEELVVQEARNTLTDENIDKIAKKVEKVSQESSEYNRIKVLEKQIKEFEKGKNNLIDSLKTCEVDTVRKLIFDEIQKMDEEQKVVQRQLWEEKSNSIQLSELQIKFFLSELKKGSINDLKYRKMLIDVLIDKIYVYDDDIIISFNVQDKNNKKTISRIEEISGSFFGVSGAPLKRLPSFSEVLFLAS